MKGNGPHLVIGLEAVETQTATAAELTARIINLYDQLAAISPETARDLVHDLPAGWHGPHIVH